MKGFQHKRGHFPKQRYHPYHNQGRGWNSPKRPPPREYYDKRDRRDYRGEHVYRRDERGDPREGFKEDSRMEFGARSTESHDRRYERNTSYGRHEFEGGEEFERNENRDLRDAREAKEARESGENSVPPPMDSNQPQQEFEGQKKAPLEPEQKTRNNFEKRRPEGLFFANFVYLQSLKSFFCDCNRERKVQ